MGCLSHTLTAALQQGRNHLFCMTACDCPRRASEMSWVHSVMTDVQPCVSWLRLLTKELLAAVLEHTSPKLLDESHSLAVC